MFLHHIRPFYRKLEPKFFENNDVICSCILYWNLNFFCEKSWWEAGRLSIFFKNHHCPSFDLFTLSLISANLFCENHFFILNRKQFCVLAILWICKVVLHSNLCHSSNRFLHFVLFPFFAILSLYVLSKYIALSTLDNKPTVLTSFVVLFNTAAGKTDFIFLELHVKSFVQWAAIAAVWAATGIKERTWVKVLRGTFGQ